jgi:hypothetical protein
MNSLNLRFYFGVERRSSAWTVYVFRKNGLHLVVQHAETPPPSVGSSGFTYVESRAN